MLNDQQILTLSALALCFVTFVYAIVVRHRSKKNYAVLIKEREELQRLKEVLTEKEGDLEKNQDFQNSLKQAEVTTGLQQTRISFHNEQNKAKAPERYAYVLSMFRSGIPAEEISTALGMSLHEIRQLLTLSTLSEKTETAAD